MVFSFKFRWSLRPHGKITIHLTFCSSVFLHFVKRIEKYLYFDLENKSIVKFNYAVEWTLFCCFNSKCFISLYHWKFNYILDGFRSEIFRWFCISSHIKSERLMGHDKRPMSIQNIVVATRIVYSTLVMIHMSKLLAMKSDQKPMPMYQVQVREPVPEMVQHEQKPTCKRTATVKFMRKFSFSNTNFAKIN